MEGNKNIKNDVIFPPWRLPPYSVILWILFAYWPSHFGVTYIPEERYSAEPFHIFPMVLILDGNPEIGTLVRSNFCYLICLRHFIRAVITRIFFFFKKKTYFPSWVCNIFCVTIYYKYQASSQLWSAAFVC